MSLTPTPHMEGYAGYITAMQMVDGSAIPEQLSLTAGLWDEPSQLPALQCLKSLDDLDEEADEDDDETEDLDDEDEDEDELDEEYEDDEDEDEDEDEDDEEDEDEEEEDEDGGVKPLKMAPALFSSRLQ